MAIDDLATHVTGLLQRATSGDREALEKAYALVHDALRRIVRARMSQADQISLDATMVINDVWMKLLDRPDISWNDRQHFFCTASRIVRRLLCDHARTRRRRKRGGDRVRQSLDDISELAAPDLPADDELLLGGDVDLLKLDAAITRLEAAHPDLAEVVELRYFGGFSDDHIGQVILNLNPGTVRRRWIKAKTLLHLYLTTDQTPNDPANAV